MKYIMNYTYACSSQAKAKEKSIPWHGLEHALFQVKH